MKNKEFNQFLISIWSLYLGKAGIENYRREIRDFMNEIIKLNEFSLSACLLQPYYLSNYISFQRAKYGYIKCFFKFSHTLWDIHKLYEDKEISYKIWLDYLKDFFETWEEKNRDTKLLVLNEILKIIDVDK